MFTLSTSLLTMVAMLHSLNSHLNSSLWRQLHLSNNLNDPWRQVNQFKFFNRRRNLFHSQFHRLHDHRLHWHLCNHSTLI